MYIFHDLLICHYEINCPDIAHYVRQQQALDRAERAAWRRA